MKPWKAWLHASRPKTLSAAVAPMVVGTALALMETGSMSWFLVTCAIISAMFIQIGTNLVNDALDYKKGTDTEKRLGPQRATQSGWLKPAQVLTFGIICLAASILAGIPLIYAGGWPIFWVIFISAVMGYLYTGGPKPLSYNGLGDLFVFIFFGLVATGAMFYVQAGYYSWTALLAGAQIGMTSTIMIAINNLRDIAEDTRAEKKTLAVRFGKDFGKKEIAFLTFTPYFMSLIWWQNGFTGLAIWPLLSLPLAIAIVANIKNTEPSPAYNVILGQASILHLLWGLLLSSGALLG